MIKKLLIPAMFTLCLLSGCKKVLIDTGKPLKEVTETLQQFFEVKYLPYAELRDLQKKGSALSEEERQELSRLMKLTPVTEIVHSYPKGPVYTFIELTNLNDEEYTSITLNLYQNKDGNCSMEILVQAVKKTPGVAFADTTPISEEELRKLLSIPEETK
jgi:hypothetical protein